MVGAPSFPPGAPGRRRVILPGARSSHISTLTDRSLLLWWTLDSPSIVGTSVIDQSGHGNTGTITNGPTVTQGKSGSALLFDGLSNQYIQTAAAFNHNIGSGDYTFSIWVLKATAPSTNYMGAMSSGAFTPALYLTLGGSTWGIWDGADKSSGNPMPLGRWSNLVATRSGTTLTFYENGVKTPSTATSSGSMANTTFYVATDNGGDPATGRFDDIRVYNRALSYAEVRKLYYGPSSDLIQPIDKIWRQISTTVASGRTGTLSQTIAALTSAATGTVLVTGTGASNFSNLTTASAGTVLVTGTATPTIAALTLASAGTVKVTGTATPTIAAITASSTGTVKVTGTATPTLDDLTSSSTGTVLVTGTGASNFSNLTLSSTGTTPNVVVGNPTIDNLTVSSTGTVLVTGTLAQTIPAITLASAGTVLVTGTLSSTLDDLTISSDGTVSGGVDITGTLTATIGNLTVSATAINPQPARVSIIGATGDYTTLDAWAATLTGTFTGDQEAALLNELFTPANSLVFGGFFTQSTGKLIIRAATAAEAGGVSAKHNGLAGTGARIQKTSGTVGIIESTDDGLKHWIVKDLELLGSNTGTSAVKINNTAWDYGVVENCIIHDISTVAVRMDKASGVGTARVINCALWNVTSGGCVLGVAADNTRVEVLNSTAVKASTNVANTSYGFRSVVAKNSYAGYFGPNTGNADFVALGTGSTNNASNDSSGTAGLRTLSPTSQFVSVGGTWDLHLKAASSLETAGTPLVAVVHDFEDGGRDATTPDIGFDEFGTVGSVGSFSQTIAAITSASAGTVRVTGSSTPTLDAIAISSAGTVLVKGTLSVTIDDIVVTTGAPIGTLDATIDDLTSSSTGTVLDTGVVSSTIDDLTSASTATVRIGVSADATFPDLTLSSAGTVSNHGAVSATIDPLGLSTAGTVLVKGSLTATLGALTVSAQATDPIVGTLSSTLANITVSSTGVVYTSLVLSETVQPITIASAGTVLVSGVVSDTIDPITVGSAASHPVKGSVSATLDNLTLAAPGTVLVTGTLSKTLANLTSSSAGNAYTPVVLVKTIPAITLSSTGKVLNRGVVSKTIADLTTSSAGKVLVRGALTKTIGPFKLHTRVIHPKSGSSDRFYLQIPRFNIDHPPSSDDLTGHLLEKLRQQQQWLDALSEAALQSANTPPLNPRYGTLRYAVGDWALTLGAVGLYIYKESGWVLIS